MREQALLNPNLPTYARIFATNVEDLRRTQVIGVGGTHRDFSLQGTAREDNILQDQAFTANVNWVVKNAMKRRDIFLLEGAPKIRLPWFLGKLLFRDLPKGVKVYGWDDFGSRIKAITQLKSLSLKGVRVTPETTSVILQASRLVQTDPEAAYTLLREANLEPLNKLFETAFDKRNASLIGQIDKQRRRHPDARIVFMAGVGHIDRMLAENLAKSNRYSLIKTRRVQKAVT